jgi:cytochrome P450
MIEGGVSMVAAKVKAKVPPGPRNPLGTTMAYLSRPLEFLQHSNKKHGDIWRFHLLHYPTTVLNHPQYVKYILKLNQNYLNYDKRVILYRSVLGLFGSTSILLSADHRDWQPKRRSSQLIFRHDRIAGLATHMTDMAQEMTMSWKPLAEQQAPLNVVESISDVMLRIVCKFLLNINAQDEELAVFRKAFMNAFEVLSSFARLPFPPLEFPTPSHRRMWKEVDRINKIIYGVIEEHRQNTDEVGDLLSMLLQGSKEAKANMTDRELRDWIMTIMLAGMETSALTLTWAVYLLAQKKHLHIQNKLHTEVTEVLQGKEPTFKDLQHLKYTRMVIQETLRIYPPAWLLMRRAVAEDEIGGFRIPKDSYVLWSKFWIHRHPEFWNDPEAFDPERWVPERKERGPQEAYMPFSEGPRSCPGEQFAMVTMAILLTSIVQRYAIQLASEQAIAPRPLLTLHQQEPVLIKLVAR